MKPWSWSYPNMPGFPADAEAPAAGNLDPAEEGAVPMVKGLLQGLPAAFWLTPTSGLVEPRDDLLLLELISASTPSVPQALRLVPGPHFAAPWLAQLPRPHFADASHAVVDLHRFILALQRRRKRWL